MHYGFDCPFYRGEEDHVVEYTHGIAYLSLSSHSMNSSSLLESNAGLDEMPINAGLHRGSTSFILTHS